MYADRHAGRRGLNPVGLGASLTINAAVILALAYAAPHVIPMRQPTTLVDLIPIEPPPPPIPEPSPQPRHAAAPQPTAPEPKVDLTKTTPTIDFVRLPPIDLDLKGDGPLGGAGPSPSPSATPLPPLVGASADPRFAGDFQPTYPPSERRAGHEGEVVVRVLIGIDGRVKQIEKVSATSDAFFAATRERALGTWRFKPATRGDVPVEQWKTMRVRFVLEDE
ncbi:MAG TPA: TonB family protein [Sphingomonas sp.]|nr:TonB family protein [Sphingomonas sp.]